MSAILKSSGAAKLRIRWKRVILAAFVSELAVTAVISILYLSYRFVIAPGRPDSEYDAFGQKAGYYAAAPAAGLAVFAMAFWAVRKLESNQIGNGALVGVLGALLTVGFLLGTEPENRSMYIVTDIVRIIAGSSAGFVASKRTAHS